MTFISHAQNFEDVLLWRALRNVQAGSYIDVGAAHPDTDSVSRAFYDRGWSGINIEPNARYHRRLVDARPRDVNLHCAISDRPGRARLHVLTEPGLSTLDPDLAARHRADGLVDQVVEVATETLAEICRRHVHAEVHFLKIDAEGSERAVLAGADFATYRPWIVLVEATLPNSPTPSHAGWEALLTAADYRFVWFDGLNRYYLAGERHAALAPAFRAPPNVFDDFVRAADGEWVRRIGEAEGRAEALLARDRDVQEQLRASVAARRRATDDAGRLRREILRLHSEIDYLRNVVLAAEDRGDAAVGMLQSMRDSTSWRLTGPLRRMMTLLGRRPPEVVVHLPPPAPAATADGPPPVPPDPETLPETVLAELVPLPRPVAAFRHTIHQFHSGCATGDAITNAMLLVRGLLRGLGYHSDIFVEHTEFAPDPTIRPLSELPQHDDYVLIVRHSAGYHAFERVLALPARKVLIYHNITPGELLSEGLRPYAEMGREQLRRWAGHVVTALADSEYNAIELRHLGFEEVRSCALLFDLAALGGSAPARHAETAPPPPDAARPFTLLFVGRVTPSKGQDALIDAFASFARVHPGPGRLVLVGRQEKADADYAAGLHRRVTEAGLDGRVLLTGLLSDAERDGWYRQSDLYVSLSRHEGFGVPLIEATLHGLPVLAARSSAIAYTLGDDPAALLADAAPQTVADALLALAADPAARQALAARQRRSVGRFALDRQLPVLLQALLAAGAAPPPDPGARAALAQNLTFTVAGHLAGSYSLAVVNRAMAGALELASPGRVRVMPVELEPTRLAGAPAGHTGLEHIPPDEQAALAPLLARPPPDSGPHVVISQHYPLLTRAPAADLALAMFFWEETLVPPATIALLDARYAGVLAPSRSVAEALIDSGLTIPVHVVGVAPRLDWLDPPAADRRARPFTFLHVSSGFPRKGIDILLAAYAAAFRAGEQVRLVLKTFPNIHNDIADQIARLRAAVPELGEIELIDADISGPELAALYRAADAMVLPTRGEGFNFPAAEAMAAGLPLLVTAAGGQADFCNSENAGLIQFDWRPAGTHLSLPGSLWMEPSVEDLARRMRALAEGEPAAAARVAQARHDILALTDRAAWAGRIAAAALDVLLAPPPRPLRIAWISTWDVRCGVAEYSRNLLDAMVLPPQIAAITVLGDSRTDSALLRPGIGARPAWRLGHADSMQGLVTAIAQEDPGIVLIQHQPGLIAWPALTALLHAAALRRWPVAVTLHSTPHLLEIDVAERAAALAALGGAARVLVHTVDDVNLLLRLGLSDNVVLFPHAVLPMRRSQAARPVTPASVPVIGCYGFFLEGKGIPQLIAALPQIRASLPQARLRLINADYDSIESTRLILACQKLTAELGLDDAVSFETEFQPTADSLACLSECDVVVLPYQASRESSSAAMRTALSAGVPVAVTPLKLFDEAGDAVARLPGFDAAALADGLVDLLRDAERRKAVQVAAEAWLAERDSVRIAHRLQGMLRGLAGQAAAGTAAQAA